MAWTYIKENRLGYLSVRFDVIAILHNEDGTPSLRLIKNAFEAQ